MFHDVFFRPPEKPEVYENEVYDKDSNVSIEYFVLLFMTIDMILIDCRKYDVIVRRNILF